METKLLENTLTEIVYVLPKYSIINQTKVWTSVLDPWDIVYIKYCMKRRNIVRTYTHSCTHTGNACIYILYTHVCMYNYNVLVKALYGKYSTKGVSNNSYGTQICLVLHENQDSTWVLYFQYSTSKAVALTTS